MDAAKIKQSMIEQWGLSAVSPAEQDEYIDRIGKLLYQAVILRVTEDMTDEDKDALDTFMSQNPEADAVQILDFLSTRIPDFSQILGEETAKLKELIAPPVAA